ncbi:hypothetical protein [Halanaerobium salsuginis]|uniref:hypothetical protein n=1 Tax=Halanaerobium salsuginis TaxID=29563 RepID=UPI0015A5DE6D|nr:hypothetical protein [Halanaerobium salsuginis]
MKVSDNTALVKKFISKTNQELLARIYKKNDQIFIKENPYLEKINYKYQGGNIN